MQGSRLPLIAFIVLDIRINSKCYLRLSSDLTDIGQQPALPIVSFLALSFGLHYVNIISSLQFVNITKEVR